MHELDVCFILSKGTVWRSITDIITHYPYHNRVGRYTKEIGTTFQCAILVVGKFTVWRKVIDIIILHVT